MKRNEKRPSDTRGKLIQTATKLFSEKGYDGITVDEIVDTAGVNKRMVYHYFGSKEAIYQEVLREVFGRLTQLELTATASDEQAEVIIEKLVRVYFKFLVDNPEFVQLLLWENLSKGRHLDPVIEDLSKAPILKFLQTTLEEQSRRGQINSQLNPKHLLINLIGLCFIYFSNRYTLSQTVGIDLNSPAHLNAGIKQVIELFKRGMHIDIRK